MVFQAASILVYVTQDYVTDALRKLPFVRALRTAFPQSHISWLAGRGESAFGRVLAPMVSGLIDEVIEAPVGRHWWELLRPPVPERDYDLIIDTQHHILATLAVRRIPHGTFLSSTGRYLFSDFRPVEGTRPPPSRIRQMLDLLELASGVAARQGAPLSIPRTIADEAERRLPDGFTYVGIAPGAGDTRKCWPLENFIALGMRQTKAGRVPVFFLGPNERHWENEIRDALPASLLPLEQRSSPLLTIALGRRLNVAVANDSGAGHMLAAAEAPLISLFGPTDPSTAAPMTKRLTIIRAQDFGGSDMQDLPLSPVAEAVERILMSPYF